MIRKTFISGATALAIAITSFTSAPASASARTDSAAITANLATLTLIETVGAESNEVASVQAQTVSFKKKFKKKKFNRSHRRSNSKFYKKSYSKKSGYKPYYKDYGYKSKRHHKKSSHRSLYWK